MIQADTAVPTFWNQVGASTTPDDPTAGYGYDLGAEQARTQAAKPAVPTLYTNAAGGAMLFEHGNYRWLQPGEVASATTYVKAHGGVVKTVDDSTWAGLVTSQSAAGSSGMATGDVPVGKYAGKSTSWDAGKLADLTHRTPKYNFARIASNFDTTDPSQREQMLAMLRADPSGYFKNATLSGDKLVIGGTLDPAFEGISTFDVFGGSGAGLWSPTWQPAGGPGYVPETTATDSTTALPSAVSVPGLAYTPRDYGSAPQFASTNPYQGMSEDAYRLLVQSPTPTSLSTLALPAMKR